MYNKSVDVKLICTVLLCTGCVLTEAQECGDNPIKQVLLVAKRTGRTLSHVLTLLKEIDNPAYENLARRFRTYAACVGLVDTGYFRKRSDQPTVNTGYFQKRSKQPTIEEWHSEPYALDDELTDFLYEDLSGLDPYFNDIESNMQDKTTPKITTEESLIWQRKGKKSDGDQFILEKKRYNVDRLKKWLKYRPYRNYMNSYYIRWNLLWPLTNEN